MLPSFLSLIKDPAFLLLHGIGVFLLSSILLVATFGLYVNMFYVWEGDTAGGSSYFAIAQNILQVLGIIMLVVISRFLVKVEKKTMIYFAFDEFDIANDELSKLKKILKIINPSSIVYIVGHTDHVGPNQYNLELSEKRAQAVKNWIIDFSGLNENQFIITFKGESKLLNSGTTSKERSINRRVSVKLLNH